MESSEQLYSRISQEIKENTFARVPTPVDSEELEDAADSFIKGFLNLPEEEKESLFIHIPNGGRGSDLGFVGRRKANGDLDDKQFFHYNPIIKEVLAPQLKLHIPEVDDFITKADHIYKCTEKSVAEIMQAMEFGNPGIIDKFITEGVKSNYVLRFLAYDRNAEGQFLAVAHFDRGAYTIALKESAPGLRAGTGPSDLREVEYRNSDSLFFKGRQQVPGVDDGFNPAWHDVIQRRDQSYSEKIARWAIVCFIEPLEISMVTKEQSHTPTKV